jgi:phage repressor protein C with HTH and peptisase S24 domain
MLKHADVWRAIDRLAQEHGLSPSGLARKAGLDPTTFNKSKRITREGRPRWPSTESISKILAATESTLAQFVDHVAYGSDEEAYVHRIPLVGLSQAGAEGYFDDAGFPKGQGWDQIAFPDIHDRHAYALEIAGDSMEPVYREGDIVVVSPGADIRRGDRIVVKTTQGEVMAKVFQRQTATRLELSSFNPAHGDRTLDMTEVLWRARIVWARQ